MNTTPTDFRRLGRRLRRSLLLPALCALGHISAAQAATTPDQLIDATRGFLEPAVEKYLSRSAIEGRSEIEVNRLDPRLRLGDCDQPLAASLESPAQPIGRVTVRVQCPGSSPWTVFVPAQVRLFRPVVVANRPLQRQVVLSAADISLAERDVGLLPQGYLTQLERALGQKLGRAVTADQVLAPSHLEKAEVVHKGDQVVITASNGGISVRAPGEALADGAEGQQIRVRNLGSGRVVKARVTGPGQVVVNL